MRRGRGLPVIPSSQYTRPSECPTRSQQGGKDMATEVEILGHKAKIGWVFGRAKRPPLQDEDQLVVVLKFNKAVGSVLTFGVAIPAKKYECDEFLYNVRRRGGRS